MALLVPYFRNWASRGFTFNRHFAWDYMRGIRATVFLSRWVKRREIFRQRERYKFPSISCNGVETVLRL